MGALARRADELYQELSDDGQEAARQMFLRLVTLGEGQSAGTPAPDTRRRILRSELLSIAGDGDLLDEIVDSFAAYRLLSLDRDPASRAPTVELAHEAILREWGRLRGWLADSREDIRLQRQLASAAAEWQAAGHEASFLLRGSRLEQLARWSDATALALTPAERNFLQASLQMREAEQQAEAERQAREARLEQRSRTVLRVLVGVFAVAALVSGGFGLFALNSRNAEAQARQDAEASALQAQTQAALLLGSQAESELDDSRYDLAVLLALEALENYPYTPQAEHALGQAVSYNRALQQYTAHQRAVTSVDWSPDGTKVASSSTDNTVHVWDAATGDTLLVINLPEGITGNFFDWALAVKWTPDGERLLTVSGDRFLLGSQDYDLILWDATTGEQIVTVEIPNTAEPVYANSTAGGFDHFTTAALAAYAPDSARLATVGGDNTAILWDAALQEQVLVLAGHENAVNGVAWSPDELQLATASADGTARIWDVQSGETVLTLSGHEGDVNQVIWSPDGSQLATAGKDGTIRLWNANSGEQERLIEPDAGRVWSLAWSSDGSYLITGSDDAHIYMWDVDSGRIINELAGHDTLITHVAWSPVDNRLASAGADGLVRIWNAAPSTAALTLPYGYLGVPDWTSDSRYLAVAAGDGPLGSEPFNIAVWDINR